MTHRAPSAPRRTLAFAAASICALAALLALAASPAFAARGHVFGFYLGSHVNKTAEAAGRTTEEDVCPAPGHPSDECQPGESGSGGGQFQKAGGLAVDEAAHRVYVTDNGPGRERYGDGHGRVERFSSSGAYETELTGPTAAGTGTLTSGSTTLTSVTTSSGRFIVGETVSAPGLPSGTTITAVDEPAETLEVSDEATASESASLSAHQSFVRLNAAAVDNSCAQHEPPLTASTTPTCEEFDPSAGDLYVSQLGGLEFQHIILGGEPTEGSFTLTFKTCTTAPIPYDASTTEVNTALEPCTGYIGVFTQSGALAISFLGSRGVNVPQIVCDGSGLGPQPAATCTVETVEEGAPAAINKFGPEGQFLGQVSEAEAPPLRLSAVDPSNGDVYVPEGTRVAHFTAENELVERFGEGHLTGASGVAVDSAAKVTAYVADAGANRVAVFPAEPPNVPTLSAGAVDSVGSAVATIEAVINPRSEPYEAPTSYRFEYGPCPSLAECASSPYPDSSTGTVSPDFEQHRVTAEVEGLQPATDYHFRLVAENSHGSFTGEEVAFTTFPAGLAFALPDSRAWELVSPPDKNGAAFRLSSINGIDEAAADGGAITYVATGPIDPGANSALEYQAQVLSRREPGGWISREINPPSDTAVDSRFQEYNAFSEDLTLGELEPPFFIPTSGEREEGVRSRVTVLNQAALPVTANRYVADLSPGTCESSPPPESCYAPIFTTAGLPAGSEPAPNFRSYIDTTPDLGHLLVSSPQPLSGRTGDRGGIYEWSASAPLGERMQPVSVLSDGLAATCAGLSQNVFNRVRAHNAISHDGSRVFWATVEESAGRCRGEETHLYARDLPREETVQIDRSGGAAPHFLAASADGSRVFFGGFSSPLEVCELGPNGAGHLECSYTQLSPSLEGRSDVLGVSEDGTRAYFVAAGHVLTTAHLGASGWETQPIGTLAAADASDWAEEPRLQTARVSPDGRWLAFMSRQPLTGYDNRDAASGERDAEVFLYDAEANGGAGKLTCASCNPTGARPNGAKLAADGSMPYGASGSTSRKPGEWMAAWLPDWMGLSGFQGAPHQPRYLSDSGRLFFNSYDALAPQDTNGAGDVYEWEPAGVGGCTASSATYSERDAGCVSLISSGASNRESAFVDASESGDDAFFLTASRLVGRDYDTAYDLYDARVGGGFPEEEPPTPCEGGESCHGEGTHSPSTSTPGSSTVHSHGNLHLGCSVFAQRTHRLAHAARALRHRARLLLRRGRRLAHARDRRHRRLARRYLRHSHRLAKAAQHRAKLAQRLARRTKRCRRAAR